MDPLRITALVITYNEAANICRVLDSLRWAHEVLLVDSFSTDATLELAGAYPNVRVVQRKFDTFAQQCNFGLDQIATPWVLSLDADYFLPHEFHEEIVGLDPPDRVCGYEAAFKYSVSSARSRGPRSTRRGRSYTAARRPGIAMKGTVTGFRLRARCCR